MSQHLAKGQEQTELSEPQSRLPPQDQVKTSAIKFMENKVDPFIREYQFQVDFNRVVGILFSFTSIGLSLGITLAGINNDARLAAGLGAASAAVQSAFGIFPLEKRVWFYRASVAEAHKIKSSLEYKAVCDIDKAVDNFEVLRTKTLTQEPLNSIPDSFSPNTTADKQPDNGGTVG
jgi:hypothetical protein